MRQLYINLKPALKAIELSSKTVFGTGLIGNYPSFFKGGGLEFSGYSPYTPMDDAKLIDWKASLKANTLLRRDYVQERNMNIFFLIDSSSSMIYTSQKKLKAEYSGEVIASLAYVMMKENDLVGFAMFNRKINSISLPARNIAQFYKLVETLSNKDNYGGACNLKEALDFAFKNLKPKTMLFIVSDFLGLTKGWEDALRKASSKHEIVAIMVRDPVDFTLPETHTEEILVRSPFSKKIMNVRLDPVREKYKEYVNKQTMQIKKVLSECNVDLLTLTTDKSFIAPLLNFFVMRRKKRWK